MELADIYLKAAQVIKSNGHAKGDFYSIPEGVVDITLDRSEWLVCALGALAVATFGDPYPPPPKTWKGTTSSPRPLPT
ncbi:DUF6197 family protein [Streptomyces sp. NPDC002920]